MTDTASISENPSPEEIRAQLSLVLAGASLAHAPKLASFLRFVVEVVLTGRSDRLKGYTIAVEALGRRSDFDPETDAIVRVDAIRIRRALARYYATEGAQDPIVIDLPRRSYVPTFSRRAPNRSAARETDGRFGRTATIEGRARNVT
jgi:hypothetical protein